MKKIFTTLAIIAILTAQGQTSLTCGKNVIAVSGQKISTTKFIGDEKKDNAITNYYYQLAKDNITIWEEYINEGVLESVAVFTINKKDISTTSLPYLDEFTFSNYESPVQRLYIQCTDGDCMKSTKYQSWVEPGKESHDVTNYYQIDGSDKKVHQELLDKILTWLKN
ncbi:MAG: hypothetical protein IPN82_06175 [Chitinophagaceae bacterium]|nr:hypothetical protein [Chitinophagaceae bacterium]MBK8606420.1 hypothetical protein [Chitinophagaceae bacterium]MBP6476488.1 hypothetical protein [Chitinophagaceae bacterium]MBP7314364.1 hypothetical protein [Chitinophagaceae bacterium]HQX95990.1 hypothetical protein [Chitinophagaceae bacterium]